MTRVLLAVLVLIAAPAAAQSQRGALEVIAGYAAFVDDAFIDHGVVGGSARIYLSPRISAGPEIVYMRGPGNDRDLFVTGNMTFDLVAGRAATPFLVASGGFFRETDGFGAQRYSHVEGAITGGGGARFRLSDRLFALGEIRLGWEPHYRVTAGAGVNW